MFLLIGVTQILIIYVKGGFGNSTFETKLHKEELKLISVLKIIMSDILITIHLHIKIN